MSEKQQATGDGRQATGDGRPMRRGGDIAERLLQLSVVALRVSAGLPRDAAARHVANQLVRSATGSGANYEEARAAESRADFVHKVSIAAKEIRETIFWLQLVERSGWSIPTIEVAIQEARELAAILAASARTARANLR